MVRILVFRVAAALLLVAPRGAQVSAGCRTGRSGVSPRSVRGGAQVALRVLAVGQVGDLTENRRAVDRFRRHLPVRPGGVPVGVEPVEDLLEADRDRFDIVISCTASSLPIIGLGMVERASKARRRRPIFMVDLAVPRDIEPEVNRLDDVYLYTVDDLGRVVQTGMESRRFQPAVEGCPGEFPVVA
jgi:hypothetical protein